MPYEGEAPANPYLRFNPWSAAPGKPYTWTINGLPERATQPAPVEPPIIEPEPAVFETAPEPQAVCEPDDDLFEDPIGVASFFRPGRGATDPLDGEPEPEFLDDAAPAPSFFRPGLRPAPAPEPAREPHRGGPAIVTERPIVAPMDIIGAGRARRPETKAEPTPETASPTPKLELKPEPEPAPSKPVAANFHSVALAEPLARANRLVLTPVVEELPPPRYAPAPRSTFEREPAPAAKWAPLPLNGETDARLARRLRGSGAVDPFPIVQPAPMSRRDYGAPGRARPRWPALFAGVGVVSAGALGVGAAVLLLRPHGIAAAAPAAHATRALAIEPAPDAPPPESSLIAEPPAADNAPPAIAFTPTLHRSLARASRRPAGGRASSDTEDKAAGALSIAAPAPIVLAPEPSTVTLKPAPAAPLSPNDPIATTRHDS